MGHGDSGKSCMSLKSLTFGKVAPAVGLLGLLVTGVWYTFFSAPQEEQIVPEDTSVSSWSPYHLVAGAVALVGAGSLFYWAKSDASVEDSTFHTFIRQEEETGPRALVIKTVKSYSKIQLAIGAAVILFVVI